MITSTCDFCGCTQKLGMMVLYDDYKTDGLETVCDQCSTVINQLFMHLNKDEFIAVLKCIVSLNDIREARQI